MKNKVGTPKKRTVRRNRHRAPLRLRSDKPRGRTAWLCAGDHVWEVDRWPLAKFGFVYRRCRVCWTSRGRQLCVPAEGRLGLEDVAGPGVRSPAPAPCGSCPYRLDVPSGVWAEEEYAKLPLYDRSIWEQPTGAFMCHQQTGRLCAGWVGCHDMQENLAIRLAQSAGLMDALVADACIDYRTSVPLFTSGQAAADHGLAEIAEPSSDALRTILRLTRKLRQQP